MLVQLKETQKAKLKNPVIIEGFPGIGMIGTIASSYLADKLGAKLIGNIASPYFPPIAAIHDYKPVFPARIYASEKHNAILIFSEFVIPANVVTPLSDELYKYAKAKKAKAIYSLAGIAVPEPADTIHGIASTDKMAGLLKKNKVELIKEGATQGVSGLLIAQCASVNFPAANLMAQTNQPMDPKAAARLIEKLSEVTGIKIETKSLVQEGEKIEGKMRDAMEKMKESHSNYQEMEKNQAYA